MKTVPAVFYTSLKIPVLMVTVLLFAGTGVAEPVYKSTNAKGEVVFSDEPPPDAVNVEQIEIQPAPTEAQHREGVQRARRVESMADEMGAARQDRTSEPVRPAPKNVEEQPVQTYADGDDDNDLRRRHAIAGEHRPGVEHRAPAHVAPHAAGGGRR